MKGVATRSCTLPVSEVQGAEITTIEGLSPDGTHPLQRAWEELDVARQNCRLNGFDVDDGAVEINDLGQTSIPGVYAAGDMARRSALPVAGAQVILAAAEGTLAAIVIDQELLVTSAQTN